MGRKLAPLAAMFHSKAAMQPLTDARFLALKALLATALALACGRAISNPDVVTTAFVALLCCSPAVLLGGRICLEQLIGSAIGGSLGTAAVMAGLPPGIAIPAALAAALFACHLIRLPRAATVAAFTALFVQAVAFGGVGRTLVLRLEAVAIAGASAFVVNLVISSLFYGHVFAKRFAKVEENLEMAFTRSPELFGSLFAQLSQLEAELSQARLELRFWPRRQQTLARLERLQERVELLRRFLHQAAHLRYQARDAATAFFVWLWSGGKAEPELPPEAASTGKVLVDLRASISSRSDDF
jgi:uncharacterized membrane protein YgaE (UPF0421/DUF939 family)